MRYFEVTGFFPSNEDVQTGGWKIHFVRHGRVRCNLPYQFISIGLVRVSTARPITRYGNRVCFPCWHLELEARDIEEPEVIYG